MATLKSREILAARQQAGAKSVQEYKDPHAWQKLAMRTKRNLNSKDWLDWVQNPIGILGGVVTNAIQTVTSGEALQGTAFEGLSLTSGTLSYTKLWRYKILMKGDNGMEKTDYSPRPNLSSIIRDALPFIKEKETDRVNLHTTKTLSEAEKNSKEAEKVKARRAVARDSSIKFTPAGIDYVKSRFEALESLPKRRKNDIIIINASVSPYQSITLQNRPNELSIDPKSSWASINSMGRNNPFMMYTGGEDTISFEISWFANDPQHRDEVIWKCKLLESWSKANGYMASPPVLNIKWGASDIFSDDDFFILESARYTLTNFQDQAKKYGADYGSDLIDLKLVPNCATQTVTFKRVTMANTTHNDIVPLTKLQGISGITGIPTLTTV